MEANDPTDVSQQPSVKTDELKAARQWQRKLYPVMVRMLLGTAAFFFLASLGQLAYLHWRIEQTATLDLTSPTQLLTLPIASDVDRRANALVLMRGLLEADAMQRRHQQARVLLMARTWTVYLGFVTGMSLAFVGAALILGKIEGPSTVTKLEAATMKAAMEAATPGITLVFLGVVLMIATIVVNHEITVQDRNTYLVQDETSQRPSSQEAPPRFPAASSGSAGDPGPSGR